MMNVVGNATVDSYVFFFNDAATTETYTYVHTLPLHDALPIFTRRRHEARRGTGSAPPAGAGGARRDSGGVSVVAAGAAPGRGHGSRHRADRRRLRGAHPRGARDDARPAAVGPGGGTAAGTGHRRPVAAVPRQRHLHGPL